MLASLGMIWEAAAEGALPILFEDEDLLVALVETLPQRASAVAANQVTLG